MTKNENNSHSFLRKMVENIKQTKDAQAPDDPKANEVSELQRPALFYGPQFMLKCSPQCWFEIVLIGVFFFFFSSSIETVHRL